MLFKVSGWSSPSFGLTSARQHRRIAQIASAHKRRNWKPTMAIKRIESQTTSDFGFYLNHCWLFCHQSNLLPTSSNIEINALWSFQGICHDLLWKPNERDFGHVWPKTYLLSAGNSEIPRVSDISGVAKYGKICRKQRTQNMETCATGGSQTQSILFKSSKKYDSFSSPYPLT